MPSSELPPFESPEDGPGTDEPTPVPDVNLPTGASDRDSGEVLRDVTSAEQVEARPGVDEGEALTQQQQTLIMGDWASVCGNCGENAMPRELRHVMDDGSGCGVEWKYVTADGLPVEMAARLRPDLAYVEPDYSQDGITVEMEEKNARIFEDPDL